MAGLYGSESQNVVNAPSPRLMLTDTIFGPRAHGVHALEAGDDVGGVAAQTRRAPPQIGVDDLREHLHRHDLRALRHAGK